MTIDYFYRNDNLGAINKQANDPWLRAHRKYHQRVDHAHKQLIDALAHAGPNEGVFALSMWRTLEDAMRDLRMQFALSQAPDSMVPDPLLLQRVRADHPFFSRYHRDDDEHLAGQAWLFWNTVPCPANQDWSTDGIPHSDIEVFHPGGYWAPFNQVVETAGTAPPGWTRIILPPAYEGESERTMDARWVDHSLFGPFVHARVPVWSPGVWPADHATRQIVGQYLFEAFPDLKTAGQVKFELERTGYTQIYDLVVGRRPATHASRFDKWFRGASDQPAFAWLDDALLCSGAGDTGIEPPAARIAEFVYGAKAMATLESEAAKAAP